MPANNSAVRPLYLRYTRTGMVATRCCDPLRRKLALFLTNYHSTIHVRGTRAGLAGGVGTGRGRRGLHRRRSSTALALPPGDLRRRGYRLPARSTPQVRGVRGAPGPAAGAKPAALAARATTQVIQAAATVSVVDFHRRSFRRCQPRPRTGCRWPRRRRWRRPCAGRARAGPRTGRRRRR